MVLMADVFKIMGNSAYGEFEDEKAVDRALHSACFEYLTEIGRDQLPFSGGHRDVPAGEVKEVGVLL